MITNRNEHDCNNLKRRSLCTGTVQTSSTNGHLSPSRCSTTTTSSSSPPPPPSSSRYDDDDVSDITEDPDSRILKDYLRRKEQNRMIDAIETVKTADDDDDTSIPPCVYIKTETVCTVEIDNDPECLYPFDQDEQDQVEEEVVVNTNRRIIKCSKLLSGEMTTQSSSSSPSTPSPPSKYVLLGVSTLASVAYFTNASYQHACVDRSLASNAFPSHHKKWIEQQRSDRTLPRVNEAWTKEEEEEGNDDDDGVDVLKPGLEDVDNDSNDGGSSMNVFGRMLMLQPLKELLERPEFLLDLP